MISELQHKVGMAPFLLLLRQKDGQVHFLPLLKAGTLLHSTIGPFVGQSNLGSIHQAIYKLVKIKCFIDFHFRCYSLSLGSSDLGDHDCPIMDPFFTMTSQIIWAPNQAYSSLPHKTMVIYTTQSKCFSYSSLQNEMFDTKTNFLSFVDPILWPFKC